MQKKESLKSIKYAVVKSENLKLFTDLLGKDEYDKTDLLHLLFDIWQLGSSVTYTDIWGKKEFRKLDPLSYARIVEHLLEKGAKVNVKDENGMTPLLRAASFDRVSFVDVLLRHKADHNITTKDGTTALMIAFEKQNNLMIEVLLKYNADLKLTDNKGNCVLHYAAKAENLIISRSEYDGSDYHSCYRDMDDKFAENLHRSVQTIGDIDIVNKQGVTPLAASILKGNLTTGKWFLENGADVNRVNKKGETALIMACKNNRDEFAEILLTYPVEIDCQDNNGMSALQYICLDNLAIAHKLISQGAKRENIFFVNGYPVDEVKSSDDEEAALTEFRSQGIIVTLEQFIDFVKQLIISGQNACGNNNIEQVKKVIQQLKSSAYLIDYIFDNLSEKHKFSHGVKKSIKNQVITALIADYKNNKLSAPLRKLIEANMMLISDEEDKLYKAFKNYYKQRIYLSDEELNKYDLFLIDELMTCKEDKTKEIEIINERIRKRADKEDHEYDLLNNKQWLFSSTEIGMLLSKIDTLFSTCEELLTQNEIVIDPRASNYLQKNNFVTKLNANTSKQEEEQQLKTEISPAFN